MPVSVLVATLQATYAHSHHAGAINTAATAYNSNQMDKSSLVRALVGAVGVNAFRECSEKWAHAHISFEELAFYISQHPGEPHYSYEELYKELTSPAAASSSDQLS